MPLTPPTQFQMVITMLQEVSPNQRKASEIAKMIFQRYPEYCEKKAEASTQKNKKVTTTIANEIGANCKNWNLKYPQFNFTSDKPRLFWWDESTDNVEEDSEAAKVLEAEVTQEVPTGEIALYSKLAVYLESEAHRLHTKRIDEKTSSNLKGKNANKHRHPDVVGLEDRTESWSDEFAQWAGWIGAPKSRLWSFEVKVKLNSVGEARVAYHQALNNSSWAHRGYLVASEISSEALAELKQLHQLHGIGVIKLNSETPEDSTVLLLSIERNLDWDSCSSLCINKDFKSYIQQVALFHRAGHIEPSYWGIE